MSGEFKSERIYISRARRPAENELAPDFRRKFENPAIPHAEESALRLERARVRSRNSTIDRDRKDCRRAAPADKTSSARRQDQRRKG